LSFLGVIWNFYPFSDLNDSNNAPGPCPTVRGRHPEWVAAANGVIPANAVLGGYFDGDLYIARASHEGSLTPGYVKQNHSCHVSWGGQEHTKGTYEVLCGGNGRFITCENAEDIPDNAFEAGNSEDGEPLFIGRVRRGNALILGKVQPSHEVLYIPYEREEQRCRGEFEIFVLDDFFDPVVMQ
jgi:hypothetical protein